MPEATVVVPTHDHGPTLVPAVRSALEQTVRDLEVFIVGDGMPAAARAVAEGLVREDPRVRLFENPKGPRHGEVHRRRALGEARGRIVCYLGDDDLYLPDHVETMARLLERADFANTTRMWAGPDARLQHEAVDLEDPGTRRAVLEGLNRIGLTQGAHTLALYRRLPHGWRTTPEGRATDHYMWQQILAEPGCRAATGAAPTTLSFPSPSFRGWSSEERRELMKRWAERIRAPGFREEAVFRLLVEATARIDGVERSFREAQALIETMRGTLAWRAREALLSLPLLRTYRHWRARRPVA